MNKSLSPVIRYLILSFSSYIPNGYVTDELKKKNSASESYIASDR